ncbi:MAG TPA: Tm-1-like ATP-binding domain-containing protein [Vicinamibacterales bacterium]
MRTVLLIGTLDTKGPEIAYVRDRLRDLGVRVVVADSGILGEPLDIVPDVSRAEVARLGGTTIDALRQAGSRGKAVHGMLAGLRRLALDMYQRDELHGVAALGGAEGAVLGASAMTCLPIGVPKVIVTPIASGRRHFGPLVGTRDVMVIHSVVDILGLNPISTAVFDNVAAALAGMVTSGGALRITDDRPRVALTMLGNTTKPVMAIRDRLAGHGIDSVIFHSNGVGGPAMEELAEASLFAGVIDYTTDELADELVGGFHNGGPERLRRIGRLGLPQVVVPGCIDFTVHGRPEEIPQRLQGRPIYTHNPEFTLVRTLEPEMAQLGRIFAERLNEATGPTAVMVPTEGLSIPNVPGGPFWDPAADAAFLEALRKHLRADIPLTTHPMHINAPEFAQAVADRFLELRDAKGSKR